ncbi:MAG: TonB-dependent receptor [Pseudomonadota bacterium]
MALENELALLRAQHLKLVLAAGASAVAMSVGMAYAQDDPDEPIEIIEEEADEDDGDRVVVTGSRLRRNEFDSISPVQVISGEVARDLGLVDAADILAQTTVVQGQQTTTGLSTSAGLLSANGPGSATASLRGLNAGRTLVLINGRRLAPAGVRGAPSAPDLNLIPGTLVERVDVLLDGASSVYGSDAVAGVVNYVLRSDFEGLQLDAFVTDPELDGNGGQQEVYTATWGASNDDGFIGFAVEHSRTDGFTEREFGSFYEPYAGNCQSSYTQGASGTIYDSCSGAFGAGSASTAAFGFLGNEPGRQEPGLPAGFFRIPVTADLLLPDSVNGAALLNWPEQLNAVLQPNFTRTTFFTTGEYDTGRLGGLTTYFEASYSSRNTDTNSSGQGAIELPGDYAVNNFGGLPGTLFYESRFLNETEVAQARLVGGIRGDLEFVNGKGPLDNWTYDAYASYSRSNGTDFVRGVPFFPRLEQTLSNTRLDPDTGEFVCDPRGIVGEGQQIVCRPLDFFDPAFLFSGRFPDQADNDYLFPARVTNTIVQQTVYTGAITGDLFEFPAGGTAGMVLGVEYRKDEIRTDTDAGASGGDFLGFFSDPGSNGERDFKEAFIEIEAPILRDQRFAEELTINAAARYTEESEFGSEWTYRIQGQYAPVDWIKARVSYGTSFRAPNLGEQFGGRVVGFGNPNDPCRVPGVAVPFVDDDNDPSTPDVRLYDASLDPREPDVINNCINGGGPFGLEGTDPFELGVRGLGTQNPVFLGAPTQVASGSNPELEAETSEAISAGFVFDQTWNDAFDLRISGTYFRIEVFDEVNQLSAATIVNRCYQSPGLTDQTCEFITRDPRVAGVPESGEISFVEALNQNLGTQIVEGVDYNAEFGFDFELPSLDSPIDYNLILRATQSLEQTVEEFRVDEIFVNDQLNEFGNPEWRVNITNTLQFKDFSFLWQSRYISDMIEDNDDPEDQTTSFFNPCVQADDGPCLSFDNLDEYWVHDTSVVWRGEDLVLRAGISNVLNTQPPLTNNNGLGNIAGIGYDLGGRTYFLNVSKSF